MGKISTPLTPVLSISRLVSRVSTFIVLVLSLGRRTTVPDLRVRQKDGDPLNHLSSSNSGLRYTRFGPQDGCCRDVVRSIREGPTSVVRPPGSRERKTPQVLGSPVQPVNHHGHEATRCLRYSGSPFREPSQRGGASLDTRGSRSPTIRRNK